MINVINDENMRLLGRLGRKGDERSKEISVVISPGARTTAWAVKVESNSSYNVYNVQPVEVGDAGSIPTGIGSQTKAVNLAESFTQTGQLAAGTYVLMCRVGSKNVFYAPV